MEGISKQELIRVKENMPDGTSKLLVHTLITMCKELPDQQWQTIDEFKANPVDGLCFVNNTDEGVMSVTYIGGLFFSDGDSMLYRDITHVMPIKTPEAPK